MLVNAVKRLLPTLSALLLFLAATSWAEVHTGTYIGDGTTNRSITGIPFQPDVVIMPLLPFQWILSRVRPPQFR